MSDTSTNAQGFYWKPLYPVLMSSSFQRNDISEKREGVEAEKFARGTVSIYLSDTDDDFWMATCEFSAGEESNSKAGQENSDRAKEKPPLFEVKAEYVIALRTEGRVPDDKELTVLFADLAAASAWPLFRAHFALISSQGLSDLPALPIAADFITTSFVGLESNDA